VAERSQVALNCRCFNGEFHCLRQPAKLTALWVVSSVAVFLGRYAINLLLVGPSLFASILGA
jgi:hypothetical protein